MSIRPIVALVLLVLSHTTLGCSCGRFTGDLETDVRASFRSASLVAVATVASVSRGYARVEPADTLLEQQVVTWQAVEIHKGSVPTRTIKTETVTAGYMCGRAVEVGQTYLLYLDGPPPYSVSFCSLSTPFEQAKSHIEILRTISTAAGDT